MSGPESVPVLGPISPLFVVRDVSTSVAFYRTLGFEERYRMPPEAPFFAIVGRDVAQLFLKTVSDDVPPSPNSGRHDWVPWDAFVHAADPDALEAEWDAAGLNLHRRVQNRDDGLRGLEVRDPDGYVLFFGRPS